MMKKRSQNGFAHPGMILMLLVIVAVALIGYKVEQNHNKNLTSAGSTTPVVAQTVQTIQSKADLNSAENSLNSQNIDGDLNPSQFNQDVSSLL